MKKVIMVLCAISIACGSSFSSIVFSGSKTNVLAESLTAADVISGPQEEIKANSFLNQKKYAEQNVRFNLFENKNEFILLDKTEEGFFVAAADSYGTHVFDTNTTVTKFDVDSNTNIAYWLNNDFKKNGNNGMKLPEAIIENIIWNHLWTTECGKAESDISESKLGSKNYTITCGISLLSAHEAIKYSGKYGYRDNLCPVSYIYDSAGKSNNGWWLRTASATTAGQVLSFRYDWRSGNADGFSVNSSLMVRPVFWLNADFFKKVKIDAYSAGKDVKKAIAETCSLQDIELLYSEDELEYLKDAETNSYIYGPVMANVDSVSTVTESPKENVMFVDGKGFVMLDEANGTVLFLACDSYGNHVFDSTTDTSTEKLPGRKFDVNDVNNIGYWLNNDFKSNGNGDFKLPKGIVDYIDASHVWKTEICDDFSTCAYSDSNGRYYNTTAGIVLMARHEYLKYAGKFGTKDNVFTANKYGWLMRTGASIDMNTDSAIKNAENNKTGLKNVLAERGTDKIAAWDGSDANQPLAVRPEFYLKADFFKYVKIDMNASGDNIIELLRKYTTRNDLETLGYTNEEIARVFDSAITVTASAFEDANGNTIHDVAAGGYVKGKVTVANNSGSSQSVTLIAICFDGSGEMKKATISSVVTLNSGDRDVEIETALDLPNDIQNAKIRLLLWNDLVHMKPLTGSIDMK